MSVKIGVVSLGCMKNRVDTETMLGKIAKDNNYTFVQNMEDADVIIINTCAFIGDAKEESINVILEAEQLKKFSGARGIIVVGCLPERFKEEFEKLFPRVDAFLGIAAHKDIEEALKKVLAGEKYVRYADKGIPEHHLQRVVTTVRPTAYVKIAEGCSSRCTYCVIPSIRGPQQSRTEEDVLSEIEELAGDGYSEIVLIAQDSTNYGVDLYGERRLARLMDRAAKIEGVKWLRVLYCYPEGVTDELLSVMASHENIPNYLDIPVQHVDDGILKAMGRKSTYESIRETIERIRRAPGDFIIRSTVIVGFPGETREIGTDAYKKIKELAFDRLGAFSYSQEEGTPAALLAGQNDEEEKLFRKDAIMSMQAQVSFRKNEQRIGKQYAVLVEGRDEKSGLYYGRSYAEAPDIDGKILIETKNTLEPGKFYQVKITKAFNYDCLGEVADEA